MVYAVIDTNIFVSALITHNPQASTVRILKSLFLHRFTPLYNDDIIEEYEDVLSRRKFKLTQEQIRLVIDCVKQNGMDSPRFPYDGDLPDKDDCVFYEVALGKEESFLVTGSLKHFPDTPKVVTASEMMEIIERQG